MTIDTKTMISISDANRNFSSVENIVDQYGSAVILKNNTPKYIILEFNKTESMEDATDEEMLAVSSKLISRNRKVYQELVK
ncbi:MAG: type II toxin-antitoxin system Phd/YefM family antitoxin [Spirochaetales bacterium]|nr:type II toxin-antitoxin system Phd/YefM family antitoxin [Spirochaetales bacterium]